MHGGPNHMGLPNLPENIRPRAPTNFSEEELKIIEQNRQRALERKRKRAEMENQPPIIQDEPLIE